MRERENYNSEKPYCELMILKRAQWVTLEIFLVIKRPEIVAYHYTDIQKINFKQKLVKDSQMTG